MTRFDLMNTNAQIVKSVVKEVVKYAPKCKLMIVSNPVDIMTYISYSETGFSRKRLFGMGNILDTMRFRTYIANELNVSREDTRALVIGEHGDSMVPLVEYASVSGIPITNLLTNEQIEKIVHLTVTSGADVIQLKGSTVYAPGTVIAITGRCDFDWKKPRYERFHMPLRGIWFFRGLYRSACGFGKGRG